MKNNSHIAMLGTAPSAAGGIASVISVYGDSGIMKDLDIIYITTHCNGSAWKKLSILFKACCNFTSLIVTGKVKIVHLHLACGMSFWRKSLFAVYTTIFHLPLVIHLHSGYFPQYYRNASSLTRLAIRSILRRASASIAVSSELKSWLDKTSNSHYTAVIHNPIYMSMRLGVKEREKSKIVFLGRIEPAKGILDLILAVQRISLTHPDIRLVIAGTGDIAGMKKMAADLGIAANIDFPGWVAGPAKSALLSSATLLVLPSYAEGMPMAVLEAMAHGTAVIATDVGGIPEAVRDTVEGLLVPAGDVSKLAQAIALLLSNSELRERMGKAGKDAIRQRFSPASTSAALSDLYARLQPQRS